MSNKQQIDPNLVIDIATAFIPDTPPKTLVGRILRWIKGANKLKNSAGIKIK